MVRVRYLLVAILIISCGLPAFLFSHTGEEAHIMAQLDDLRETVSKNGEESAIPVADKARKINQLFTGNCRIDAAVYDITRIFKKNEIGPSVMTARSPFRQIVIRFHDVHIADIRKDRADVNLTATIDLLPNSGSAFTETHEIACRMDKTNDRWRFSEIRTVNVLER